MRVVLLALASGVLSGILFELDFMYLPGALFALAVLIEAHARRARPGLLRAALFVGGSVLANALAVLTAIYVKDARVAPEMIATALAGVVGALALGIAARLALGVRALPALGVVGGLAGAPFLGLFHPIAAYVLWQVAIAAVLARAWPRRG